MCANSLNLGLEVVGGSREGTSAGHGKLQGSHISLLLLVGLGPAFLINHVEMEMMEASNPSTPAAPKQPAGIAQVTVNSLSKHSSLWTPTSPQMLRY